MFKHPIFAENITSCIVFRLTVVSIGLDRTNYERYLCLELGYEQMLYHYWPLLYPIHDLVDAEVSEDIKLPTPLRLTSNSLVSKGVYLLDNGTNIFIRFNKGSDSSLSKQLFGYGKTEAENLISPEVIHTNI